MSVSISDMQSAVSDMGLGQIPTIQISKEIGNVIEVTDLSDDLGLNLLANQSRNKTDAQTSFGSAPIRLSVAEESLKPIQFETLEPIDLSSSFGSNSMSNSNNLPQVTISRESNSFDNFQSSSTGPSISLTPAPPRDLEKERQEKIEYLNKLQRLETKGYPVSKRFTMDNTFEEIKQEYPPLMFLLKVIGLRDLNKIKLHY